jgi:hypothetical protein
VESWRGSNPWRRLTSDGTPGAPRRGDGSTRELLAVAASRRTGAEITITTDEGDTVTLSLRSELDASFAVYRRPRLEAASLSIDRTTDLEITVQGDLSEREREDIRALVTDLARVIRGFLAGSFDASVVRSFDDLASNSLAGYTLHVERAESLTMLRSQREATDRRELARPAPEPVPFVPTVIEPGSRDAQPPATRWRADTGDRDVNRVVRQMLRMVLHSGLDLGRLGRHLEKALRSLLHRTVRDPGIEPATPALEKISDRLRVELEDASPVLRSP